MLALEVAAGVAGGIYQKKVSIKNCVVHLNQVYSRLMLHVGNIFAFFRRKCVVLNGSFNLTYLVF